LLWLKEEDANTAFCMHMQVKEGGKSFVQIDKRGQRGELTRADGTVGHIILSK
jgi:hypothetical protein